MLGPIARALVRRAPLARQMATERRGMTTLPTEIPSFSGTGSLLVGVGSFVGVFAWVTYNDLIVWGMAPPRSKPE